MKIKNKITGWAILLSVLCIACTEERLIGEEESNNIFSITLSSGSVAELTKGYENSDPDELKVSSCFIGIYDATTKDKLFANNFSNAQITQLATGQFKISNITLPVGQNEKECSVVVIANPPENNDYSSLSYQSLKSNSYHAYTDVLTFRNSASTLIKVGEEEKIIFSSTKTSANITLTQLAVKIRLILTLEEKVLNENSSINIGGVDAIEQFNKIGDIEGEPSDEISKAGLSDYLTILENSERPSKYFDKEGQTQNTPSNSKWLKVKCDSVQVKTISTWTLIKSQIKLNNITLKSPIFANLESNPYLDIVNTGGTLVSDNFKVNVLDMTFYTYQKDFLAKTNESKALNVTIEGDVQKIKSTSKREKVGGTILGIWTDKEYNVNKGWGGGSRILPAVQEGTGFGKWSDWTTPSTPVNDGNPIPGQTFVATINPKKNVDNKIFTDGLIHGNYYEVRGNIKVNESQPSLITIEWDIVGWTKNDDINIGFN